jgi:hypothetical protein
VALFQAFVEAMEFYRQQGHHLTWKATKVGDPIPPGTDAVIVSVMLPRSLNCPYALGVMWAMSEALRLEVPLVVYLTDWAFFRASNEFKSIAKAGQPYFSKKIGGSLQYNEDPDMIQKHGEALLDLCRQWNDDTSLLWKRAAVMVPKYTNWGDMKIIQKHLPGADVIFPMDPTPIFLRYIQDDPNPTYVWKMECRNCKWLLPSLLKNDDWVEKQNLRWPVQRYGPKGFEVLATERDIQAEYRLHVGAICSPYPTVGSGWWRSRWIHAAIAKTVLLCDRVDGIQVGPAYLHSGQAYESATLPELAEIAQDQSAALYPLLQPNLDVLKLQLDRAFHRAGV